jgi:predicted Zn-ribbon and HTH transcriptional regulator
MTTPHLILAYLFVSLGALAGMVIYTELRQRRFQPTPSKDTIFRCKKCGYVYTDDPGVDRSRCSQCGQVNEAIQF